MRDHNCTKSSKNCDGSNAASSMEKPIAVECVKKIHENGLVLRALCKSERRVVKGSGPASGISDRTCTDSNAAKPSRSETGSCNAGGEQRIGSALIAQNRILPSAVRFEAALSAESVLKMLFRTANPESTGTSIMRQRLDTSDVPCDSNASVVLCGS